MRYMSVCSGIEAATVAWHSLGWKPAAFAEIDKFPRAVLQHHYPEVPIHGDFTTIGANDYGTVNLLVGGTPCQSFSIAGLRGGLDDDRGNLALEFMRLAARMQPTWIVWENVPGVLSSNGGRDFGSILGALGELGYGWAYRVLDAQHFGVPQRRRRVFVVGCIGSWQRAAAVLFERHSVSGNPPPRREKRETAPTVPARRTAGGGLGTDFDCDGGLIARCVTTGEGSRQDAETPTLVPIPFDPRQIHHPANYSNPKPGDVCHPLRAVANCEPAIAFSAKDHGADAGDLAPTLRAMGHGNSHANGGGQVAVAFADTYNGSTSDVAATLGTQSGDGVSSGPSLLLPKAVRRLTPRECERLQGFPDDYTAIPWRRKPADQCPDGPRYKALGNSMAVPVMRWIGQRIAAVTDTSR
jgi:DNA (cytosine-5)-methyltransferase 1